MPLNREEKELLVQGLRKDFETVQTLVIAEYRGVKVSAMTELRRRARDQRVSLRVIKNTLARLAVRGTSFESLTEYMKGPLIYGYSEDPIGAAKVIYDFSRDEPSVLIRAGFYDGRVMSEEGVKQLASIPSRGELLSRLLFVMQAPVSGMARVIAALAEKKSEKTESI